MNSRSSNITYLVFVVVVTVIFTLLMSTRFICKTAKASYSVDYEKVIELGDYYVKISDAMYLTDTNQIAFAFNVKAKFSETESTKPEITSITTNISYKDGKEFFTEKTKATAQYIIVSDIEEKFTYVTIYFATETEEKKMPDTVDEFGDVVEGEIIEAEKTEQYVRIDRSDMLQLTSEQKATMVTTKAKITTAKQSGTTSATVNAETQTVTTTVTTTAETTETTTTAVTVSEETLPSTTVVTAETEVINQNVSENAYTAQQYSYDENNYYNQTEQIYYEENEETYYQQPQEAETATSQTETQQAETTTTVATTAVAPSVVHVNAISLDTGFSDNNVRLTVGGSHQLKAVVQPDNSSYKSVAWSSNRTDIATVDGSGVVTAHSSGKAIITASTADGGLTASCMVSVE